MSESLPCVCLFSGASKTSLYDSGARPASSLSESDQQGFAAWKGGVGGGKVVLWFGSLYRDPAITCYNLVQSRSRLFLAKESGSRNSNESARWQWGSAGVLCSTRYGR